MLVERHRSDSEDFLKVSSGSIAHVFRSRARLATSVAGPLYHEWMQEEESSGAGSLVPPVPRVTRVTHALRYRRLSVQRVEPLTPGMRRIVLGGEELEGFASLGFDDHVKLFIPDAGGYLPAPIAVDKGVRFPDDQWRPEGRDFTPRRYDAVRQELTIDFGLHGSGPATNWARLAAPGHVIGLAGPRGSEVLPDDLTWHLLVGDETALPAIARRLEERPSHVRVMAVIEVDDESEHQALVTGGDADITWVHRLGPVTRTLDQAVADVTFPNGRGLAWVAGEASMARSIRQHLLHARGVPAQSIKAAAYWRQGAASRHELIQD
jgi:NADPH-dependent ferric siderophore reductase